LQHAYYYQLSVVSTVSEVAVLHCRYAGVLPVSLVFALHMIKIWLKTKPTVNHSFYLKNRLKLTANPKMETVTAQYHFVNLW